MDTEKELGGDSGAVDRREEILQKATLIFGQKGFVGTRMTDVADAIGLTKPIVYRYFSSKEELFQAVMQRSLGARHHSFVQWADKTPVLTIDALNEYADLVVSGLNQRDVVMTFLVAISEAGKLSQGDGKFVMEYIWPVIFALSQLMDRTRDLGQLIDNDIPSVNLSWLLLAPAIQMSIGRAFALPEGIERLGRPHMEWHIRGFARAYLK